MNPLSPDPVCWAIETSRLGRSFRAVHALRDVTLQVPRSECVAVLGPNGAGKSTLLRVLSTLLRPTSGTASVAGWNVQSDPDAVRRAIGLTTHQPMLHGELSAAENLLFYAHLYGVSSPRDRVAELLTLIELYSRRNDFVRTFSRGMQQRLTLARCLLHSPSVLLLDEPYTGLDQRAAEILNGLIDHLRTRGCTILLTTHDLTWVSGLLDEVIVLDRGRLLCQLPAHGASSEALSRMYQEQMAQS
ncbi:MAG TPA: ABC transporter ATP-binding protein [Anaerolineae bacterium]|nr:ABC transporter ATP-binding protein [Anaerolineae bacterium]HQJ50191.1 ABC transporter ATP-binding protein [Anaerolineae bacterium]